MVVMLCGTAQFQVHMTVLVADLPIPGTIVLNLPEQGTLCLLILQISHGDILLCRPVACISYSDSLGRTMHGVRLSGGKSQLMQIIRSPVQLFLPCIVGNLKHQLLIKLTHSLLLNAV